MIKAAGDKGDVSCGLTTGHAAVSFVCVSRVLGGRPMGPWSRHWRSAPAPASPGSVKDCPVSHRPEWSTVSVVLDSLGTSIAHQVVCPVPGCGRTGSVAVDVMMAMWATSGEAR